MGNLADIKDRDGRLIHVKNEGGQTYTKTTSGGWTKVPGGQTRDPGEAGDKARSHHGSKK